MGWELGPMGPGPVPMSKGFPKSWKFPWRSLRHWQDGKERPHCSQPWESMLNFWPSWKNAKPKFWKLFEMPTNILDNINKQKKDISASQKAFKIWIKTKYYSLFLMYKNTIIIPLIQFANCLVFFSIFFKRFWYCLLQFLGNWLTVALLLASGRNIRCTLKFTCPKTPN